VADRLLRIKVPSSKNADAYAAGQPVRVGWARGDAVIVPL